MIPRVTIERVATPAGEMTLSRRGDEFSIRVRGIELMNSQSHQSEDELGRRTCAMIRDVAAPRVLVGGLGLGFTLRAVLDSCAGAIDVVELVPDVVRWNRTVLADLAGRPLEDPRVTVIEDDVGRVIEKATGYHAIILDVDNGPDELFASNAKLYRRTGLVAAFRALVPGGVYAAWSSFESDTFTKWLRDVGFDVTVERIKGHGGRHVIWLARRPDRG
jgi:spermidine synthase